MSPARSFVVIAAALVVSAAAAVHPALRREPAPSVLQGPPVAVGNGAARLFVAVGPDGKPRSIGIALTEPALSGLAEHMNSTSRCFDRNGDGTLAHGECLGDEQVNLELPAAAVAGTVNVVTARSGPTGMSDPVFTLLFSFDSETVRLASAFAMR